LYGRLAPVARQLEALVASRPLLLALSATLALACAGPPPVTHTPSASDTVEQQLRDWYAALSEQPVASHDPRSLLAARGFDVELSRGDFPDEAALGVWVRELRTDHARVAYHITAIRVEEPPDGPRRALVELDREAVDDAGLRHLARREHTWWIDAHAGEQLTVLGVREQRLIVFPGTGPQIVCY
jgi:hypothetical protein